MFGHISSVFLVPGQVAHRRRPKIPKPDGQAQRLDILGPIRRLLLDDFSRVEGEALAVRVRLTASGEWRVENTTGRRDDLHVQTGDRDRVAG